MESGYAVYGATGFVAALELPAVLIGLSVPEQPAHSRSTEIAETTQSWSDGRPPNVPIATLLIERVEFEP
jgi:hypothetical protein